MKIAYLISAHTDPIQLKRLITALNIENVTSFFIHIDKKVNIKTFTDLISGNNIFFIKNRIKTNWGAFSQCKYQIALIEACLNNPLKFNRVFFLSGLDYPLWSNNRIINFLSQNKEKEFIMGMNLTNCNYPPKMQTRVKLYHFRDIPINNSFLKRAIYGGLRELLKIIGITKNNFINCNNTKLDVYCGSSWWCISNECLNYVFQTIQTNKAITHYFKTCIAPDELLIQTIVFNSKFAEKALLYKGEYPGLVGLTPLHYIEYTNKIATYSEKDFNKLIASDKMFCRKLQTGISDKLMDKIDQYRHDHDK